VGERAHSRCWESCPLVRVVRLNAPPGLGVWGPPLSCLVAKAHFHGLSLKRAHPTVTALNRKQPYPRWSHKLTGAAGAADAAAKLHCKTTHHTHPRPWASFPPAPAPWDSRRGGWSLLARLALPRQGQPHSLATGLRRPCLPTPPIRPCGWELRRERGPFPAHISSCLRGLGPGLSY